MGVLDKLFYGKLNPVKSFEAAIADESAELNVKILKERDFLRNALSSSEFKHLEELELKAQNKNCPRALLFPLSQAFRGLPRCN